MHRQARVGTWYEYKPLYSSSVPFFDRVVTDLVHAKHEQNLFLNHVS